MTQELSPDQARVAIVFIDLQAEVYELDLGIKEADVIIDTFNMILAKNKNSKMTADQWEEARTANNTIKAMLKSLNHDRTKKQQQISEWLLLHPFLQALVD